MVVRLLLRRRPSHLPPHSHVYYQCLSLSSSRTSPPSPRTYTSTSASTNKPKPYYITTPIFYPNAKPHIGHLYTQVLGDVFARWQRLVRPEREVQFLVGTDEHGMKIQQAAERDRGLIEKEEKEEKVNKEKEEEGNRDVLAFCDRLSAVFKNLADNANISYTGFARTTDEKHKKAVEYVWRILQAKNYIYQGDYEGWYSVTDECFYTDAQVMLAPSNHHISKETGSRVEWSKEHNYMFRLSALRDALLAHYSSPLSTPALQTRDDAGVDTVVFPTQYNNDVLQMLHTTNSPTAAPFLADISISRPRSRLSWGVPVPDDPAHTVYVWFDALLVYLSGVGYPWIDTRGVQGNAAIGIDKGMEESGWAPDIQIIGKDILRFHALYLPAVIMALNGPTYTPASPVPLVAPSHAIPLPAHLLTHAHWTVSQQKMSKSVGNVVDPFQVLQDRGVDVVRWYLVRVGGRFRDDVDWSSEQLDKHSKELQSMLGNYFLRVTSARIAAAAGEGRQLISSSTTQAKTRDTANELLAQSTRTLPARVKRRLDKFEVGEAVEEIEDVLRLANKTLTTISPWSRTCAPQLVFETRQTALETLRVVGVCLVPFVPGTAAKLLDALKVGEAGRTWGSVVGQDEGGEWVGREGEVEGVRLF